MQYVNVLDSTSYIATGTVRYAGCGSDGFTVTPSTTWTAGSRGFLNWCLVTGIDAVVKTPTGNIGATSYSSSGTGYSSFAVIQTGANSFAVTHRTDV